MCLVVWWDDSQHFVWSVMAAPKNCLVAQLNSAQFISIIYFLQSTNIRAMVCQQQSTSGVVLGVLGTLRGVSVLGVLVSVLGTLRGVTSTHLSETC